MAAGRMEHAIIMMLRTFASALALAAFATATPAFAEKAPFEGFHIDALVGWDQAGLNEKALTNELSDTYVAHKTDGITYGAAAGYDIALKNVRLGIEAEFSDSSAHQDITSSIAGGKIKKGDLIARLNTGRDLYIGGRIGVVLGEHAMLYGKAGYANVHADVPNVAIDDEGGEDGNGWRIGAGLEYALTSHFSVKAEYRYSAYDAVFDGNYVRNQVIGGASYHF
jgi:outer membrane immunogenic protein